MCSRASGLLARSYSGFRVQGSCQHVNLKQHVGSIHDWRQKRSQKHCEVNNSGLMLKNCIGWGQYPMHWVLSGAEVHVYNFGPCLVPLYDCHTWDPHLEYKFTETQQLATVIRWGQHPTQVLPLNPKPARGT